MEDANDLLEQLDRHLMSPNQAWLFGAGISRNAGIPLMGPLTDRVRAMIAGTAHQAVFDALFAQLPEKSHVEHLLSHLGDYAALADRAKREEVTFDGTAVKAAALTNAHNYVVRCIAEIVRWGYKPAEEGSAEEIGTMSDSIVAIDEHSAFMKALFSTSQAGLQDRRGPIRIFTTNYDTLLEDALALCSVPYWDGFCGGAVAFRNFTFGEPEPATGYRAHLVKLHGSIDWHLGEDGRVWRVRDGDRYPSRAGRVLIHPQATKYTATQHDPFAAQFDLFRRSLSTRADNVLAVCGYSFGDEHINQEIEYALSDPENRTTVLAFLNETNGMPGCVEKWRDSAWAKRLYVLTEKGVYAGATGPFHCAKGDEPHDWWTFAGVTRLLRDGAEGYT